MGSPDPGSIKVVAPYSGANQYVDIQKSIDDDAAGLARQDMHVRIKVASGNVPGGAQVYAITVPTQYVFGGTFTNFANDNNWQEFTVNLDSPMTPDHRLRSGAGHHRRRPAQHRQRGHRRGHGDVHHRQLLDRSADRRWRHGRGRAAAAGAGGTTGAGGSGDASAGN